MSLNLERLGLIKLNGHHSAILVSLIWSCDRGEDGRKVTLIMMTGDLNVYDSARKKYFSQDHETGPRNVSHW